jgi:O-antigen ligase
MNHSLNQANKKIYLPIAACVVFVLSLLWQGAYFPIQFIPLAAMPFVAFALSKRPIVVTINTILFTGLILLLSASLLLAKEPQIGLREWIRYLLIPLYLIFFTATRDKSAWQRQAFFVGISSIAVLGLMAYAGGIIIPAGVIEHSGRFQSTIQYANTTALLMLIGILYAYNYFTETKKWRYIVLGAGLAYCLYLTGSRTTFVLFFLVGTVFALAKMNRKPRLIAIGVLAGALIGALLVGGRIVQISLTEPTLIERVITWQDGLRIAVQYPWLGLGVGNWQFDQFLYQSAPYGVRHIHNFYVHLLVDGGWVAALLFIAAILNGYGVAEKR